jgi:ubiquitin-conjugating enzyme E2 S
MPQNASSMRRLAKDQATLRTSTPPNYLFPQGDELPDDLTQLIILITGAHGTPYSQGVWKLHLKMPEDYPINPPKAIFKTRIFHPNVDENTGAVCLETLKRDWDKKLTLKDILVTISCLLINPNPDSALNAEAGSLLQEDYDAFARKAKLMTSIHAPIPKALKEAVSEAKRRGEEEGVDAQIEKEVRPAASRAASSTTSVVMKSRPIVDTSRPSTSEAHPIPEDEEYEDDTKENDPLHSPLLSAKPPSTRRVLGKRALSDVPTPVELDWADSNVDRAFNTEINSCAASSEPPKKSPKLARSADDENVAPLVHAEEGFDAEIRMSSPEVMIAEDKENMVATPDIDATAFKKKTMGVLAQNEGPARPTLRKVSNVGSSRGKAVPRVGIRRL